MYEFDTNKLKSQFTSRNFYVSELELSPPLIQADNNMIQILKTVHTFTRDAIQFHYF